MSIKQSIISSTWAVAVARGRSGLAGVARQVLATGVNRCTCHTRNRLMGKAMNKWKDRWINR